MKSKEQAQKFIDSHGIGTGTNITTSLLKSMMVEFANEFAGQQKPVVAISPSKDSVFVEINGEMKQYYSSKCVQENFKPKQKVQTIEQGEKICDCPECGCEIINGISQHTMQLIKNSKLFQLSQRKQIDWDEIEEMFLKRWPSFEKIFIWFKSKLT